MTNTHRAVITTVITTSLILLITILYHTPAYAQKPRDPAQVAEQERATAPALFGWSDGTLGDGVPLHNVRGELQLYVFPVIKRGGYAGEIVVSAGGQFIEGRTETLFTDSLLRDCPHLVRIATGEYGCRRAADGALTDKDGNVLTDAGELPITPAETLPAPETGGFTTMDVGLDAEDDVVISGLPDFGQFRDHGCAVGCGPTAGANLLWYWAGQGYPNLRDGTSYADWKNLALDLNHEMGTWCTVDNFGQTFPSHLAVGLEKYTFDRGYYVDTEVIYTPAFTEAQSEIDAGRPVLIGIKDDLYNGFGHELTVFGYTSDHDYIGYEHPGFVILSSNPITYDNIDLVTYDIQGSLVMTGTNENCGIPGAITFSPPIEHASNYTFTYLIEDHTCSEPDWVISAKDIGVGLNCSDVITTCTITDVDTRGGLFDSGQFVDAELTDTVEFTFSNYVSVTEVVSPLSEVKIGVVQPISGTPQLTAYEITELLATNLVITRDYEILDSLPVSPCRNPDPNFNRPYMYASKGAVTVTDGIAHIGNTITYYASYEECYLPNPLFYDTYYWQLYEQGGYSGLLEDWPELYNRQAYGAGTMALRSGEILYQIVNIPSSGSYTLTVEAQAHNAITTPLWIGYSRYPTTLWNAYSIAGGITSTAEYPYPLNLTLSAGTYMFMVGRRDQGGGDTALSSVCLRSASAQPHTMTLQSRVAHSVRIPLYSLLSMTVIARARTAGTTLLIFNGPTLIGSAVLGTDWSTHEFAFVNDVESTAAIVYTFDSEDPAEWIELDYACIRRDDEACLMPWSTWQSAFRGAQGPENPEFTSYTTGDYNISGVTETFNIPANWEANKGSTVGYPAQYTTSQVCILPTGLSGANQEYPPSIQQLLTLNSTEMRLKLSARATGGAGRIWHEWIYNSNSGTGDEPDLIPSGLQSCDISSSEWQSCTFDVDLPPEYSYSWGQWWLYIGQDMPADSAAEVEIDSVCVQLRSTPDYIPTRSAKGLATPTSTALYPTPDHTATPWPTLRTTWTPDPLTATPEPVTPWPTTTPFPTNSPTASPSATAPPTDTPITPGAATETATATGTFTPTATLTPTNTPTPSATPTLIAQPTAPAEIPAECCTYCVYWSDGGIHTAGSISCDGCDTCSQFAGGIWWERIINAIPWLVCKFYFKIVCPIVCFLKGWLTFFILWLKANTVDFVVNLLQQVIAVIRAFFAVLWAAIQLIWEVIQLIFTAIALIVAQIRVMIAAIGDGDSADLAILDEGIFSWVVCLWEQFEWFVWSTPAQLFLYLFYVDKIWNFAEWAVVKLSDTG